MALSTQPYKGTRDFYPDDMKIQKWMFSRMRQVAESYGYREYDGPMLEAFELYAAKTGEEIVNNQLYWLIDRGERKLAIRPEMTPTLARMVAAKFHELPKPIRWFSIPNLWRYERPQRGRVREHWQLNVDVMGGDPLLADAEILSFSLDLMRSFGGEKFVKIRINNRRLMDHFFIYKLGLSAEAALKVSKAVDAREKIGEEAYLKWLGELGLSRTKIDELSDFFKASFDEIAKIIPCEGVTELKSLFGYLAESEMKEYFTFDPTVMRGLDYYTGTVFEMYDQSPENKRAMFGGGRYDNLLSIFGNYKLSGVGLGMGDVTLRNFLEVHKLLPHTGSPIDVFVTLPKIELRPKSEEIARSLRAAGLRVMTALEADGFGAQLKLASKQGAHFVVLLGDAELAQQKVAVKDLTTGEQVTYTISEVASKIATGLARKASREA